METNLVFRNEGGVAVTTSALVAETFGKEHKIVVRDIDNLLGKLQSVENQCSTDLYYVAPLFDEYFEDVPLPCGGTKQAKRYFMNEEGFTLLVMGYTGQKAMEFKVKYMAAFKSMKEQLMANAQTISQLSDQVSELKEQITYADKLIEAEKEISRLNDRIKSFDCECTPHDREWWLMQAAMDPNANMHPERMSFNEFFFEVLRNPGNICTPVSANELLITWLMENEIVITKQNLKRFRPMFRRAVEYYCDRYNVKFNPFWAFATDRERNEKAFFRRNLQSRFNGDRMVYPRERKIYGVERCWVFFRSGQESSASPDSLHAPTEYTALKKSPFN